VLGEGYKVDKPNEEEGPTAEHYARTQKNKQQVNEALRITFQLTPQETDIMGLLVLLPLVSPDAISQRLGIATEVRVAVYRLRITLKRHSIEILSRRRFGYWLTDDTKARIKELIAPTIEAMEAGAA
jgi:hypothetical protein